MSYRPSLRIFSNSDLPFGMFKKAMLPTPFRSITTEAALAHNPQKDIEPQCTLILPSISGNSKSIGRNSRRYFFLSPLVKSLGGGQADEETRLKESNPLLTLRYRPSAQCIQKTSLLLLILFRIHIFHKFPNPFLVRIALIANFAELPA